ncbi:MAG TPA: thiol peroxidase [Roseiflexaceae bacterium]|nr:thiol peroxidase [Roseiflexaceae bacterium]
MAQERPNAFDFWGLKTLVGPELKAGDNAPAFTLVGINAPISGEQFFGKPLLISTLPGIDTGVCSAQTRRFNQAAAALGEAANVLTVSADLPSTQERWCGAEGVDTMVMGSDHMDMSFGSAYGTYVKELRIESRAVFVVDKDGIIRYAEYVPNAGLEPDYDAALAVLRELSDKVTR